MLYVGDVFAPWIGLIGITEAPGGGDTQPYHVDGRKVLEVPARENFGATITCFSVPVEFAACAGRAMISPALYVADQPRAMFGFSYRTLIGDDLVNESLGYKVHLVYNASAKMGDFSHQSVAEMPQPEPRSVDLTTIPVAVAGFRPASHFVFNTLVNGSDTITALEAIIYGDDSNDPRLPTSSELVDLLAA